MAAVEGDDNALAVRKLELLYLETSDSYRVPLPLIAPLLLVPRGVFSVEHNTMCYCALVSAHFRWRMSKDRERERANERKQPGRSRKLNLTTHLAYFLPLSFSRSLLIANLPLLPSLENRKKLSRSALLNPG